MEALNSAATSLSTPITSEEMARQIRGPTDPLNEAVGELCDFMLELPKGHVKT